MHCGADLNPSDEACRRCGAVIEAVDDAPSLPSRPRPGHQRPPVFSDTAEPDALTRALLPVGRSGWAIASGYLGLFSLFLVPGPLAVLTGILAIRHMRRDPSKHGMGRAVFGIVTGGLATLLLLVIAVRAAF